LLSPLFVAWLLLSPLIAHNALIWGIAPLWIRRCCRPWLGFRHALLATMLAALNLHAFQIVFLGHRDHTLFAQRFPGEQPLSFSRFSLPDNAIGSRRVPRDSRRSRQNQRTAECRFSSFNSRTLQSDFKGRGR
jgi:hypothetical protein